MSKQRSTSAPGTRTTSQRHPPERAEERVAILASDDSGDESETRHATRHERDRSDTRPSPSSRSRPSPRSPRSVGRQERVKLGSLAALIQTRGQRAVTASPSTLGDRLLYLIARMGKLYTYQSLTAAINDHYRQTHPGAADVFSYTYIYHLISGAKSEPNERRRRALAEFFGVHEALLFTETLFADSFASTTAETARLTQVLQDARLRALALALPAIPQDDLDRLEPLIYRLTQGPLREFDSPPTPLTTSATPTPLDGADTSHTRSTPEGHLSPLVPTP